MDATKILVIDDSPFVALGLRHALSSLRWPCHIAAASEASAIDDFHRLGCDLVIMDLSIANSDGFSLAKNIITSHPAARILFYANTEDAAVIQCVYAIGVKGYLLKRSSLAELLDAISVITRGEIFVSPMFAPLLSFRPLMSKGISPPYPQMVIRGEQTTEQHPFDVLSKYQKFIM